MTNRRGEESPVPVLTEIFELEREVRGERVVESTLSRGLLWAHATGVFVDLICWLALVWESIGAVVPGDVDANAACNALFERTR